MSIIKFPLGQNNLIQCVNVPNKFLLEKVKNIHRLNFTIIGTNMFMLFGSYLLIKYQIIITKLDISNNNKFSHFFVI